jgi:hypothetical protein
VKDVKYVLVWGTSARHYPQHCGLGNVLQDEDVVQIVKKKVHKLSLAYSDLKEYLLENSTRLPYHYPWTRKNFFKRVVQIFLHLFLVHHYSYIPQPTPSNNVLLVFYV